MTDNALLSLELIGWNDKDLVDLIHSVVGEGDSEALLRWLQDQTDGDPLLATELLRFAQESNVLHQSQGRWSVDTGLGVPQTVAQLVAAASSRFNDDERRALSTAAVLGMRFSVIETATLESVSPDAFAVAEEAQLIRVCDGIAHRMIESDTKAVGRELKLADHVIGAAAIDPRRAARCALQGARYARSIHAIRTASRLSSEAFDVLDDESSVERSLLLDLALEAGDALRLAGGQRSEDILRRAAELAEYADDDEGRARAALALCQLGSTAEVGDVDPWVQDVIKGALLTQVSPDLRASLLAAVNVGTSMADPLWIRRARCLEAQGLLAESVEVATEVNVLSAAFSSLSGPDDLELRREAVADLAAIAEATADPVAQFESGHLRFSVALVDGDRAELIAAHRQTQTGATALDEPGRLWSVGYQEAMVAHLDGNLHQSELLNERTLTLGSTAIAGSRCMAVFSGQLMALALQQGRLDELAPVLDQLLVEQPEFRDWNAAGAFMAADRGDAGRVTELFDLYAANDFGRGDEEMSWIGSMMMATRAVAMIGDQGRSRLCLERLRPYAGRFSWAGALTFGPVDTSLGHATLATGNYAGAEKSFKAADRLASEFGTPLFAAEAKLGLAQVAAARGEIDFAKDRAAEVLSIADHYGAAGIARAARRVG